MELRSSSTAELEKRIFYVGGVYIIYIYIILYIHTYIYIYTHIHYIYICTHIYIYIYAYLQTICTLEYIRIILDIKYCNFPCHSPWRRLPSG